MNNNYVHSSKERKTEGENQFDLAYLNAITLSCEMQKEILKKVKEKVDVRKIIPKTKFQKNYTTLERRRTLIF